MASIPKRPTEIHKKSSSSVSIRTIGRDPEDGEPLRRQHLKRINTNLGKHRNGIELVPTPSSSPKDPLNWPTWKKEMTFGSILLSSAVVGVMKTLFVSTNRVIATQFNVSYMSAASLTGLPFVFAAISGLGTSILAAVIGKRSFYLLGGIIMLGSALGNMHIEDSYSQFMVSRIFQGVGWGMTESLVTGSIRDTFFVHERTMRTNLYALTSLLFTWGSPILSGHLSQSSDGFREAIMVLTLIQAFSITFLVFFTPETSYTRTESSSNLFATSTIISGPSVSPFKAWMFSLNPIPYRAPFSARAALKPIRALGAPSAILAFLLTFPLTCTAYGLANSLSLILSSMPTFVFPTRLGFIFIFPLLISLITFAMVSVASYMRSKPPKHLTATNNLTPIIPGAILGISGLLAFGLYTSGELTPTYITDGRSVFAMAPTADNLSLKVVSALFGMLVAASVVLSYSASAHLSSPPSSSHTESHLHLEGSYRVWQDIMTGIFIIAMPSWFEMQGTGAAMVNGLRDTSIALAVLQLVVASTAGAVLWVKGDRVRNVDARVMGVSEYAGGVEGSMELKAWDSKGSFFEA